MCTSNTIVWSRMIFVIRACLVLSCLCFDSMATSLQNVDTNSIAIVMKDVRMDDVCTSIKESTNAGDEFLFDGFSLFESTENNLGRVILRNLAINVEKRRPTEKDDERSDDARTYFEASLDAEGKMVVRRNIWNISRHTFGCDTTFIINEATPNPWVNDLTVDIFENSLFESKTMIAMIYEKKTAVWYDLEKSMSMRGTKLEVISVKAIRDFVFLRPDSMTMDDDSHRVGSLRYNYMEGAFPKVVQSYLERKMRTMSSTTTKPFFVNVWGSINIPIIKDFNGTQFTHTFEIIPFSGSSRIEKTECPVALTSSVETPQHVACFWSFPVETSFLWPKELSSSNEDDKNTSNEPIGSPSPSRKEPEISIPKTTRPPVFNDSTAPWRWSRSHYFSSNLLIVGFVMMSMAMLCILFYISTLMCRRCLIRTSIVEELKREYRKKHDDELIVVPVKGESRRKESEDELVVLDDGLHRRTFMEFSTSEGSNDTVGSNRHGDNYFINMDDDLNELSPYGNDEEALSRTSIIPYRTVDSK